MKIKLFGPPGTGKTTLCVRLAVKLMTRKNDPISPESICFITHTNKGVEEIWQKTAERYEKVTGKTIHIDKETFGFEGFRTIHSLCNSTIKESRPTEMVRPKHFKGWVNSEHAPDEFLRNFGSSFDKNEIIKLNSYMHSTNLTFDETFSRLKKRTILPKAYRNKEHLEHYLKSWNKYKEKNKLHEYTDQLLLAKEKDDFNDYRVLIVDEAQDSSWLQWEIVDLLRARNTLDYQLFAGDDDQAIFNFSGGDEQEFLNRYGNEFKHKTLRTSYRLSEANIELANIISRNYIKKRQDKEYFAREKRKGNVAPIRTYNMDKLPLEKGNWTIQCATNGLLKEAIEPKLNEKGIWYKKYVHIGEERISESYYMPVELLRALRFYLKMQQNKKIKFDELASYRKILGKSIVKNNKLFSKENVHKLDKQKDKIANTKEYTREFIEGKLKLNFNQPFLEHFDTHIDPTQGAGKSSRWKVEFNPLKVGNGCCRDYIERCLKNNQDLLSEPNIKLSTIHAMKGGENDTVLLVENMGTAFYKQFVSGDIQQRDEISRMFYTGMTRTKGELIVLALSIGYAFPFEQIFNTLYNKEN